jgi:quercetin dioxygenase-like cupin family protein
MKQNHAAFQPFFHSLLLALSLLSVFACNTKTMNAIATQGRVFPLGEKITNENFTGTAYLQVLVTADSSNPSSVGCVTFEPGARSKWHLHPAGQILVVIEGVGYYQEKGQSKKILRKGDAVKCPPSVPHWHGASKDAAFVQLAITDTRKGPPVWMEAVTDSVYHE